MLRSATGADFQEIYKVINDSALAYKGVIPAELYREPFVPEAYLRSEIDSGVSFRLFEGSSGALGVMGTQRKQDVTLIRHSYVLSAERRGGIGSALIEDLIQNTEMPLLVGCLDAMSWAKSFYRKHGFTLLSKEQRDFLRAKYWRLSSAHVSQSVVLADARWLEEFSVKESAESSGLNAA